MGVSEFASLGVTTKVEPHHEDCINFWGPDPDNEAAIKKRDEPIDACFCQHKKSWNYVTGGKKKAGDNDGHSPQS